MTFPTTSIIISVYKDTEALALIINSLQQQTVFPAEVIISEDGDSSSMKSFVNSLTELPFELIHLTQPDTGWQKNRALNKAVVSASSEYLIFIDGDCIPYNTFVEGHVCLQERNTVLCGRRSEPGSYYSSLLRSQKLSLSSFISNYILNFLSLKKDCVKHYEEGIFIRPESGLFTLVQKYIRRKEGHIVGCNFSCYKQDMIRINGFDEDFKQPTTGEDTDIERRMKLLDIQMKSCRNAANMVHLDHPKNFNSEISKNTMALMESKGSEPYCHNGLDQHMSIGFTK